MVRQARSEVTRRKIITSAVDLISEIGYPAAGFNEIIDRAEMTKGALYYHFDSKESLATAIMQEGGANLFDTFNNVSDDASPALENVIHASFVIVDLFNDDKVARIAVHLLRVFGGFNEEASRTYARWVEAMSGHIDRARSEGDLRADLEPDTVAELVVSGLLGAELLSHAIPDGPDLTTRVTRMWETMLPSLVSDDGLAYFREFVSREFLRRSATRQSEQPEGSTAPPPTAAR